MIRTGTQVNASLIQQVLFILRGANMQSTADVQFAKQFDGINYLITHIAAVRKTGGASGTCAGGIYTQPAKGGTALVAAGQNWVTLAANVNVVATLAAAVNTLLTNLVPWFSLTTGSTAACTADLFILGAILD